MLGERLASRVRVVVGAAVLLVLDADQEPFGVGLQPEGPNTVAPTRFAPTSLPATGQRLPATGRHRVILQQPRATVPLRGAREVLPMLSVETRGLVGIAEAAKFLGRGRPIRV
jgi:hypothetical protein